MQIAGVTMFRKSLLLLLPLAISACDSSQPTYSAADANSAPPPAAVAVQPPPAPRQVAATPPPAMPVAEVVPPTPPRRQDPSAPYRNPVLPGKMGPVDKINVGSCDDYVERYRACFNNTQMPREKRFELRVTLGDQMRAWKKDAGDGKLSKVAAECSSAEQKARAEFAKVGCANF
jgi:hypothetical protein